MDIYVLLYMEDSDDQCAAQTKLFGGDIPARAAMEAAYMETLRRLKFDVSRQTEAHSCSFTGNSASIVDGTDYYSWSLERQAVHALLAG